MVWHDHARSSEGVDYRRIFDAIQPAGPRVADIGKYLAEIPLNQ